MRRFASIIVALSFMLIGGTGSHASPSAGIGAEPVLQGLPSPDTFTFAPDGRIFYGLRLSGNIRIYDPSTGSDTLFFTVPDLLNEFDQGLLGLALHPNYPNKPIVYAYATRSVNGHPRNQILGIRDVGGVGASWRVIFNTDTDAEIAHQGGRILFGPDRMLYAVIGYGLRYPNSQDLTNTAGKIHRMTYKGKIPPDNPFPGSSIFAFGVRNSFGFDFDPVSGLLWDTDNGPRCNDEVNLIEASKNYGWGPTQTCMEPPPPPVNTNQDGPDPVLPALWYGPTNAPTGVVFCSGCGLPDSEGTMFFGAFNTGEIHRLVLTADRRGVASDEVVYSAGDSVISMEQGPDRAIYYSTSDSIWRLIAT